MPYIKQKQRDRIHDEMHLPVLNTVGQLNYFITEVIQHYLASKNSILHYKDYNEVMGALACISQEYYRRVVAEYETLKGEEEGDVFWLK